MPATFSEVADRVWLARHEWLDVNLTVIAGGAGLVVVDTLASTTQMRATLEAIRALGAGEVVAAINTHEHFDHTFGNHLFATVPIHAHEAAAANTVPAGERAKRGYADDPDDPHGPEVIATPIVAATEVFSSARVIDLGDRQVELLHPGRGHTAGDIVVRVPDADVLLAGDLVEESAPPAYGEDCWPMEWPSSLDLAISLMTASTVVVPGHGAAVDLDFVHE
ncbi:MAG: MBL fold metallo-hydrolase, partial [Nocardioides sp.]|nr:MBL fold metallo-hydrolase [Nocardioides sp.]